MPVDVVADRSMVDWDEVDRISATLGQSDCMICAAVAAVILRARERSGIALCRAATDSEIAEACNFVGWKIRFIVRTASHDDNSGTLHRLRRPDDGPDRADA